MRAGLVIALVAAQLASAIRVRVMEEVQESKPVLYSVVMGCLATRNQVRLLVGSARQVGGFAGSIVLVTDKPDCLAKTLGNELLGGEKESSTAAADTYPGVEGGKIYIVKARNTDDVREMKAQKTMAFKNIGVAQIEHPVSSAIYMDEDMVVGKNLDEFLSFVRAKEQDGQNFLSVFNDVGHSQGELHTGVIVMHPGEKLEKCMQAWKVKILASNPTNNITEAKDPLCDRSEKFSHPLEAVSLVETSSKVSLQGVDQIALASTKECHGLGIIPEKFLLMPTEEGVKQKQVAEFVHFTNTWRAGKISLPAKQMYFKQIGTTVDPFGETECD